jgi:hypothetical protein
MMSRIHRALERLYRMKSTEESRMSMLGNGLPVIFFRDGRNIEDMVSNGTSATVWNAQS